MDIRTVTIEDDGKVKLPLDLIAKCDLRPLEKVRISPGKGWLKIEKITLDPYDRFVNLLEEGLKGGDWKEIEKDREDGCF